jgi:ankyrin repeat protein
MIRAGNTLRYQQWRSYKKMLRLRWITLLAALGAAVAGAQDNSETLYATIRAGELRSLTTLLDQGTSPNAADSKGVTPLMNAGAIGSLESMNLLVERGAEVNAQNAFGSTALMWSANDPGKVRFLLDHGADVNTVTKSGRTALMIAALSNPSAETVRLLLERGADASRVDQKGNNAFLSAVTGNDPATIRLLAGFAGDVNRANPVFGVTPLMTAASMRNIELVKLLLRKGANVNAVSPSDSPFLKTKNGKVAAGAFTPLIMATTYGPPELVEVLLDAGAKVNVTDVRGMTPLMLAITSDRLDPAIVRMLLEHGADPTGKSAAGETALDWARKFGQNDVIEALGGKPAEAVRPIALPESKLAGRMALQRSVGLLEKTSAEFFVQSGCFACHAQGPAQFAIAAAHAKGVAIDERLAAQRLEQVMGPGMRPGPILMMERPQVFGDTILYALESLARSGYAPNRMTDFLAAEIAAEQWEDGGWHGGGSLARTPLEDDDFSRTAMAIKVLKTYGTPGRAAEMRARIDRGKRWLLQAKPSETEDYDMRLAGVAVAGGTAAERNQLAKPILERQRADGGWAQRDELASDAYATGMTLSLLAEAGVLVPAGATYQKGLNFLLATQAEDGSWHVPSRAAKFQPYFESGFPYGDDQWISSIGTAWAANALAVALEPPDVHDVLTVPNK